MYTATMMYHFKPEHFEEACSLWEEEVAILAKDQPGFVRMQFLVSPPNALSIGTWRSNSHARRFMENGAFKRLVGKLEGLITDRPQQAVWDLKYYLER